MCVKYIMIMFTWALSFSGQTEASIERKHSMADLVHRARLVVLKVLSLEHLACLQGTVSFAN